ncbi:unnamed protein product [Auanema sp. JU1783]|nr:unnamed protein product [Auanema sp. JU1783]
MSKPKSPGQTRENVPPPNKVDFICKPKFTNTLPDLPFDGKFLACPFVPINRFIDYKPTMLEKEYKFEVQCEMDMGVNIDLVDPETYRVDEAMKKKWEVDEKDLLLLEDETSNNLSSRRSAQHSKVVPWMRKTEYISSEFNRFGVSSDRQETKVGYHLKKQMDNENLYRDRQSQIDAISKTFEDAKQPIKNHYSNKGVVAVEEMPIFPDFGLWKFDLAQVMFDSDPACSALPHSLKNSGLENSIIKGMQSAEGEQYVAHFCPTVETLQQNLEDHEKKQPFEQGYTYNYMLNREYNWVVKNNASADYEKDHFMLYQKDGQMLYNELETRVRLVRRRKRTGGAKNNTTLQIQYRDPTEPEISRMTARLQMLLHPEEQKEEEDADNEEQSLSNALSASPSRGSIVKSEDSKNSSQESKKPESPSRGRSSPSGRSHDSDGSSSKSDSDDSNSHDAATDVKPLLQSSSGESDSDSD